MPRMRPETIAAWAPSIEQLDVIDWLASGYSQQACSRLSSIPVQTISNWIHDSTFSDAFRARVTQRTADFQAAKQSVHEQQVVLALQVIQDALTGELQRERGRDGGSGQAPLRYEAAVELLRGTFWPQQRGGHKQFGA